MAIVYLLNSQQDELIYKPSTEIRRFRPNMKDMSIRILLPDYHMHFKRPDSLRDTLSTSIEMDQRYFEMRNIWRGSSFIIPASKKKVISGIYSLTFRRLYPLSSSTYTWIIFSGVNLFFPAQKAVYRVHPHQHPTDIPNSTISSYIPTNNPIDEQVNSGLEERTGNNYRCSRINPVFCLHGRSLNFVCCRGTHIFASA